MASSITEIKKISAGTWKFVWTGTPPFRVFRNGEVEPGDALLPEGQTASTERIYENYSGEDTEEPPIIEIQDSTEFSNSPTQITNPPFIVLQWRSAITEGFYKIEQLISAVWTKIRTVQDDGNTYFSFASNILDDVTDTQFRITTIDSEGNEGNPIAFTFFMVRNPTTPQINKAYASNVITISARA